MVFISSYLKYISIFIKESFYLEKYITVYWIIYRIKLLYSLQKFVFFPQVRFLLSIYCRVLKLSFKNRFLFNYFRCYYTSQFLIIYIYNLLFSNLFFFLNLSFFFIKFNISRGLYKTVPISTVTLHTLVWMYHDIRWVLSYYYYSLYGHSGLREIYFMYNMYIIPNWVEFCAVFFLIRALVIFLCLYYFLFYSFIVSGSI